MKQCKTAALCVKPLVDHFDYKTGNVFTADETYIKIRGFKGYIWFIMDAAKRSIIGYQISDNRGVGPCILAMRMAFRNLEKLPEHFKFIADGDPIRKTRNYNENLFLRTAEGNPMIDKAYKMVLAQG